jgi:hypothetical protein
MIHDEHQETRPMVRNCCAPGHSFYVNGRHAGVVAVSHLHHRPMGDTLSGVSETLRYHRGCHPPQTPAWLVAVRDRLLHPNRVHPPTYPPTSGTYVVQSGDTSGRSRRDGTSVSDLQLLIRKSKSEFDLCGTSDQSARGGASHHRRVTLPPRPQASQHSPCRLVPP